MSAIFGCIRLDGSLLAPGRLEAARRDLAYQARDRFGLWQPEGSPAALGHAMTCVTPESLGEILPLADEASGLVITADARLANRADLAAGLGIPDADLKELPDSLCILRAYQAWGEGCLDHLEGDFAFAIWDSRERRLFCGHDPVGVGGFYYWQAGNTLAFSSDLYGLLGLMEEAPLLDLDVIAAWMRGVEYIKARRTFYRNVQKLVHGHAMTAGQGGVRVWAYWHPEHAAQIHLKNEAEYVEALQEILTKAVEGRTRSAHPIGAHLSGGLDSSSVAVLAQRKLVREGQSLTAISWSPAPTGALHPNDERNKVLAICKAEGIEIAYTQVTPEEDMLLEIADPSLLPLSTVRREYAVMRAAEARGIRLILSGWGGDELITFNARGYFAELVKEGRWGKYFAELRQRTRLRPRSLWNAIYNQTLMPLLPLDWRNRLQPKNRMAGERFMTPELIQSLKQRRERLQNAMANRGNLPVEKFFRPDFYRRLSEIVLPETPGAHSRPGVHATQMALLQNGHLMNRIESWRAFGSRHGIAYTYPLLDRRVVEFALGVPSDLYSGNGITRFLARKAMTGILPDGVVWNRSKVDSAVAVDQKSLEQKAEIQRLRTTRFEELASSQPNSNAWVDFDYLRKQLNTLPGQRTEDAAHGIWDALGLAFIDRRARLE